MKKLLALALAVLMIAALSTTAFAASSVTTDGGSASIDVTGTYVEGAAPATVISADITWGDMNFTYTDESVKWDPTTHEYKEESAAGWTCDTGANTITVTNHSNKAITAAFSFAKASNEINVNGSFTSDSLTVASAVGTDADSAPSGSTQFNITGGNIMTSTTLGTISVTISANTQA